jgi:hypothetical protein
MWSGTLLLLRPAPQPVIMPPSRQSDPMKRQLTFTVPCLPMSTIGIWVIS